jgi:AcrR family transcriptional regulator
VSRQAIREAVVELLRTEHPAALSIPAVAERAGVSVRTVYRYFPTKQDLIDDVGLIQRDRVDTLMEGRGGLFDNPGEYLAALWTDFERDLDAVKAQHLSPLGEEIRARRMEKHRTAVRRLIDRQHPDCPEADRRDLTDLILMLMSSSAFLDLHVRMGRSGAEAARLAWWAARAAQKQFAAEGGIDRRRGSSSPSPTDQPTEHEVEP